MLLKKVKSETTPDLKKLWWSDTKSRNFERGIAVLVRDNLKSPPLALPQPRADLRAKEKETVETVCNEQQTVNAREEISVA